jgi:hypothetical protein
MFTEINEVVKLAIIDGFVEVPGIEYNKRLRESDALNILSSTASDASIEIIAGRRYLVLPAFDRTLQYPEDWFAMLRAGSSVY